MSFFIGVIVSLVLLWNNINATIPDWVQTAFAACDASCTVAATNYTKRLDPCFQGCYTNYAACVVITCKMDGETWTNQTKYTTANKACADVCQVTPQTAAIHVASVGSSGILAKWYKEGTDKCAQKCVTQLGVNFENCIHTCMAYITNAIQTTCTGPYSLVGIKMLDQFPAGSTKETCSMTAVTTGTTTYQFTAAAQPSPASVYPTCASANMFGTELKYHVCFVGGDEHSLSWYDPVHTHWRSDNSDCTDNDAPLTFYAYGFGATKTLAQTAWTLKFINSSNDIWTSTDRWVMTKGLSESATCEERNLFKCRAGKWKHNTQFDLTAVTRICPSELYVDPAAAFRFSSLSSKIYIFVFVTFILVFN